MPDLEAKNNLSQKGLKGTRNVDTVSELRVLFLMASRCLTNEYYDSLLQSCQSCLLRCTKTPPIPCRSYCTDNTITTVTVNAKDSHWILWILIIFLLALIPAIALITIVLTKQMKKSRNAIAHPDSITEEKGNNNNDTEFRIKDAIQEAKSNNELSLPKWYNEEVEGQVCDICDRALSDYVFPLPAIEEGAAILVTTKTSACFATEAGVRGDAFVEMEQTHFPIVDGENGQQCMFSL
ncbi:tumor necrosis factor receptor superfamily member 17-like [Xenopus laevis]|uniref:BCMA TALL-1 binding domain-containing protein n=2 Tax=Xenopus laevis TaxID=8355 RepID=A0A974H1Y8_XENLA|nr:tumor necrosis factor receptor superfamily member 17-like [Xenopus laevis]OCT61475.1 hypothetical protein XELAEV_18047500mg [Xenopus laevis]